MVEHIVEQLNGQHETKTWFNDASSTYQSASIQDESWTSKRSSEDSTHQCSMKSMYMKGGVVHIQVRFLVEHKVHGRAQQVLSSNNGVWLLYRNGTAQTKWWQVIHVCKWQNNVKSFQHVTSQVSSSKALTKWWSNTATRLDDTASTRCTTQF